LRRDSHEEKSSCSDVDRSRSRGKLVLSSFQIASWTRSAGVRMSSTPAAAGPVQQLISKGKSYEAVCVSPWRVDPSGIKGQNRRNGGATLRPAVRHNGRHEKSCDNVISICSRIRRVVPGLSRQAIGLSGLPLNDERSFVREEKFVFPSSLSLFCPSLQNPVK